MELNPNLDVFGPDVVLWERGQEAGRKRLMDRDVLFKNLVEIHQVLDEYQIRHWLSHGTMLGAYRENNFIAWDDDADLGMDFSQRDSKQYRKAIKKLEKLGYYIPPSKNEPVDPKTNSPYYDMVCIKDGEKVEGWFFEKIDNHWIYDQKRCGNVLKHEARYYDKLGVFTFRGIDFDCPSDIEDWLVMMYGTGWRMPDKNAKYNHQS